MPASASCAPWRGSCCATACQPMTSPALPILHSFRQLKISYGSRAKLPSFSRVSTITGLHRHVVSDIVKSADANKPSLEADKDYQRNRLARVLSGWFESPEYTDDEGRPRVLPVEGPEPSFAGLVRSFSGDIYPKIILDELLRVGAVRVLKDGTVRALARRYTLGGADAAALEQIGTAARDLFCTLEHNIAVPIENRLFDDSVVSVRLNSAAIPLLRQMLHRRGESFLEDVARLAIRTRNARCTGGSACGRHGPAVCGSGIAPRKKTRQSRRRLIRACGRSI